MIRPWQVVLLVGLLRVGIDFYSLSSFDADPDAYRLLADNWFKTGTFGQIDENGVPQLTAFRPPLYPASLALLEFLHPNASGVGPSNAMIAGLHVVLAMLSAWLMLRIGSRLQLRFTPLAAIAIAIDPLLLRQSQLVMTETMATTFGLLVWYRWIESDASIGSAVDVASRWPKWISWFLLGLCSGLAILVRPTAAPWIAILIVISELSLRAYVRKAVLSRTRAIGCMLSFLAGIALLIVPWTLRNAMFLGAPIWATSHGGYTLLLANNPVLYEHLRSGSVSRDWDEERFHRTWQRREVADPLAPAFWSGDVSSSGKPSIPSDANQEVHDDRLASAVAWQTIRNEPGLFAWSMVVRTGWLWTPLPNPRPDSSSKWLICAWYCAVYAVGLVGLWIVLRERPSRYWLAGLMLIVSLTAIHAIYWSNMRMRAPAMPVVYLLVLQSLSPVIRRL